MLRHIDPIDYLIIGHLTQDIHPGGFALGGTAAYAGLTAQALGARVGVVTSTGEDLQMPELAGISVLNFPDEAATTFENIQTPGGRVQYIHHRARELDISMVPDTWKHAPIVHLAPVADEVDPKMASAFPNSFVGVTPQGWMRGWDASGRIHYQDWAASDYVLSFASAMVLSREDVENVPGRIEDMIPCIRVAAVTGGSSGCDVYWNGELQHFPAPIIDELDPTGAGDVFAAAFFMRMRLTRDAWDAARFANRVASNSVTRKGLAGIPAEEEVKEFIMEVSPGETV